MEKNLCIAPTLTTSSDLDKREKGAQEATLLRGLRGVTREYFSLAGKAIMPERRLGDKIAHPGAAPGVPLEEGDKS
jgi:hypothetical protein